MSLTLVEKSENILQFQSKNSKQTIDMLKALLLKAESGTLIGIAGVFATSDQLGGSFGTGYCCEKPAWTVYSLERLSNDFQ